MSTSADDTILLSLRDVDVAHALSIAPRVTAGFEKLWTAGRLRNLKASANGEQLVRSFTDGHRAAVDQLLAASREERARTTITIRTSAEAVASLLAFARGLYELLADEATMSGVGGTALTGEDLGFARALLAQAEGALAAQR